jgi:hypothetical protein
MSAASSTFPNPRESSARSRAQVTISPTCSTAHYAGAAQFSVDLGEIDWKNDWRRYLEAYITEAGVGEDDPSIRERCTRTSTASSQSAISGAGHTGLGRRPAR